jgi:small subunit ribosomal protein S20
MANHASAEKRIRQTKVRTAQNRVVVSRMRNSLKKVEDALKLKDKGKAQEALKLAQPEVMKTAQKGIIHTNMAARKISRLSARIKSL